ncbi:MAG: aminopeptidase P family N-terminal domain-containing protein [Pseudomonadota bacterium]|nr:aminopeptidase P family N-terminal domain-containing protein [Pseudomonadota bacterium]
MKKELSNIKALEDIIKKKRADYYLIATTDEFLNEYVPEYNMRLKWLTNFSGSNGMALISKKKKIFFTDGRYTLQAEKELQRIFEIQDLSKISVQNFVSKNLKKKKIIVDTKIFSMNFMLELINSSQKVETQIVHERKNSIDLIWKDKPKCKN